MTLLGALLIGFALLAHSNPVFAQPAGVDCYAALEHPSATPCEQLLQCPQFLEQGVEKLAYAKCLEIETPCGKAYEYYDAVVRDKKADEEDKKAALEHQQAIKARCATMDVTIADTQGVDLSLNKQPQGTKTGRLILRLPVGEYELTASREGFKPSRITGIVKPSERIATSVAKLERLDPSSGPQPPPPPPPPPSPSFIERWWPAGALAVLGGAALAYSASSRASATETKKEYDSDCQDLLDEGSSCDALRPKLSDAQQDLGRSQVAMASSVAFFAAGAVYVTVELAF